MSPALSDVLNTLGWTLVDFLWQGALVGFATAIALTVLRNARPQLRYLVACAGMVACLAWPVYDLWQRLHGFSGAGVTGGPAPGLATMLPAENGFGLIAYLQSHMAWLVAAWAACALALALRMMVGLAWIGQSARRTLTNHQWQARLDRLAERAGVGRNVRLRIVKSLASPITAGWWRPVVLVPAALVSGMPADLLEALLAHEVAHVKRHDYLVNLVQNVVETLLFYHPAVWWISGRIRAEREQVADDYAARLLGEPRQLARALSELEKLQFSGPHLAQAANGGDLMDRIRRLVRPDTRALSWTAVIPVLGLAALCAVAYANEGRPPTTAVGPERTTAVVDFSSCAKPHYPHDDLAAGHTGTVTLAFLVSQDGNVGDARVARSSGHLGLDQAARDAIAKCHFKPATVRGEPVATWQPIQYVWALD